MSSFDASTQRRTHTIDTALILPAAETLPSLFCDPAWEMAKMA
jgi:hypothetical protein